jgi:ankyrin repeat protein
MTYKKFVPTKRSQMPLILLGCFMLVSMGASRCGCGNPDQSKSGPTNKGSIDMEVTPTELQGDQRTITITFVPKTPGKSKSPVSLAPYQLEVSFIGNAQVYYTFSQQIDQPLHSQEKVKLEKLLSTQQISSVQAITLTVVPGLNLPSLEMEVKLLDAEGQVIQNSPVRWKQDMSLSTIKIEIGHNQVNHTVIYALTNESEDTLTGTQLRYTNISTDEEEKKVLLGNQLSNTLPIPPLAGEGRTENQFVAIDFKNAQKATFRFEVINQQNQVLATRVKMFNKNTPVPTGKSYQDLQEVAQELKKDSKDIDMDKIERLVSQPGFPIDQLTPRDENDQYLYPLTLVSRAAQQGKLEIVKLLIGKGAHVDARVPGGIGALEAAAAHGDQAMVKTLLEAGAHVNGSPTAGFAPLHLAGRYANIPMLQELLKSDQLDINKQDSAGRVGLHFLVSAIGRSVDENDEKKKQELVEITREMISKGADVNKQTVSGGTPLHWASNHPSEAFELLLNVPNIQVNVQDQDGCTPLHDLVHNYLRERDPVVLNKLSQKISLLIRHDAQIDLRSKTWEDPLRIRYSYLDNEAEQRAKDRAGKSVLELAEESGNDALIKLLKGEIN